MKVSFYRNRDKEFRKYFTKDKETSLVHCTNVRGLMNHLKKNAYRDEDWRLCIPGANFVRLPELDHRATVGPTLANKVWRPYLGPLW